jgi:hypothetical protein
MATEMGMRYDMIPVQRTVDVERVWTKVREAVEQALWISIFSRILDLFRAKLYMLHTNDTCPKWLLPVRHRRTTSAILISIWREEEGGRRRKHELSFDIILGRLGRELGSYSTNLTDVNIKLARWYRWLTAENRPAEVTILIPTKAIGLGWFP